MSEPVHIRATYNDIHKLIRARAQQIAEFKPDMLIAIGAFPRVVFADRDAHAVL